MNDSRSYRLTVSPSQLEEAYERLRSPMPASPGPERGIGYGLIVQRGLLVWMRTCSAYAPRASSASRPREPARPLPPAAERDLVSTLVSLILGGRSDREVTCTSAL